MGHIRRETRHVTGSETSSGGSGDPSPVTAWGCYHGIRACLEVCYGSPEVAGRTIAIQGVGNVGYWLAKYVHEASGKLLYADVNARRIARVMEQFGGGVLEGDEFYRANADVLAPCAIGGIVNSRTIPMIRAPILAGGANNQLDDEQRDGQALTERGITYAPDYVINAGGLINVHSELRGYGQDTAMAEAGNIFNTLKAIINKAKGENTSTVRAANRAAEERIDTVGRLKRVFVKR
jgi:leucine dehydrogenase